ncbi:hypothetical protein [Cytobacillus kochii]|uniref:Uncharacterized protein n=1 Tax=Cytobacillus kochii TaxID=859143 RepID=A0A248THB6_9BACI|nr:hypothetical protein [Cytobacillus kochii]ASV67588.1 hypothetical protein CKF48_09800 [Cytobacillus kochii]MDQ0186336.1 hypothetical protein [Cytobacillus kochii]
MVHNISIIALNDKIIKFKKSNLSQEEHPHFHNPWEIDLLGVDDFEYFERTLDNLEKLDVKIGTDDGSKFMGRVLITNLGRGTYGNEVKLKGDGKLIKVE